MEFAENGQLLDLGLVQNLYSVFEGHVQRACNNCTC